MSKDMIGERWFGVNDWLKVFESDGCLVAIEKTEASKMLTIFTLDTDLDQITLKQNSVVLANKPETYISDKCVTRYISTTAINRGPPTGTF